MHNMKGTWKKRMLAVMLCTVMITGSGSYALAGEQQPVSEVEQQQETNPAGEVEQQETNPADEVKQQETNPAGEAEQQTETRPENEAEPEAEVVTEKAEESEAKPEETEATGTKEIELKGQTDQYTITLTGPASSFPEGTELSLSVSRIDPQIDEVVESAVEKKAEEQERTVENYTAFDIRLLGNGTEIQPSGPVNVIFDRNGREKSKDTGETRVYHVDETTGKAEDMKASVNEEGKTEIETTHFSVYVVVDLDQLGGQIDLTVQHWATVNQLTGVDGADGLIESARPDGVAGNATAKLKSEDVFTSIYTDDVLKLDNTLKKNIEELSKVLLASADKENKNYELSEIWFLNDGKSADSTNRDDWTIYQASSDATVNLTKDTTVRLVYNPLSHDSSLAQDVTFYDYDVTDGKRYNANGREDPNGNYLNTTDTGINSDSNYNGGNEFNRLAVGMNSTWVDHKYHNAKSQNGTGPAGWRMTQKKEL